MGPDGMMLSRVVDNLYWMSRYLERAEHTARVIEVQINLLLDRSPVSADRRCRHTLSLLGHEHDVDGVLYSRAVIQKHALDGSEPSSIVNSIMSARENARQVREQISSEMWEQVNRMCHEVRRADLK